MQLKKSTRKSLEKILDFFGSDIQLCIIFRLDSKNGLLLLPGISGIARPSTNKTIMTALYTVCDLITAEKGFGLAAIFAN